MEEKKNKYEEKKKHTTLYHTHQMNSKSNNEIALKNYCADTLPYTISSHLYIACEHHEKKITTKKSDKQFQTVTKSNAKLKNRRGDLRLFLTFNDYVLVAIIFSLNSNMYRNA